MKLKLRVKGLNEYSNENMCVGSVAEAQPLDQKIKYHTRARLENHSQECQAYFEIPVSLFEEEPKVGQEYFICIEPIK